MHDSLERASLLCAGVWFDSEATFRPNNVASTEIIDRKTPSSEVCMANGYSSMVFDQRIFVSFNPCAPDPSPSLTMLPHLVGTHLCSIKSGSLYI